MLPAGPNNDYKNVPWTQVNSETGETATFLGTPHNVVYNLNSTNLHVHGLWVSPAGQSDNVLITVSKLCNRDHPNLMAARRLLE